MRGIIRTLQIDTYTATGTPPQAAGVNSNTERVSFLIFYLKGMSNLFDRLLVLSALQTLHLTVSIIEAKN